MGGAPEWSQHSDTASGSRNHGFLWELQVGGASELSNSPSGVAAQEEVDDWDEEADSFRCICYALQFDLFCCCFLVSI